VASFNCLTFLTDYGLEDGFVAACHGVSSQIAPNARIIDITHLVPPGDIRRGAAVLAQTIPYLPAAVHVAVVDPGVGTSRRAIAVAAGASVFVGPDNGLLSWAVEAAGGAAAAVSLTNRALWLGAASATFHGRDIFMPVAAHLAAGTPLAEAGERLDPASLVTLPPPVSRVRDGAADAEVVTVDRFGNAQLSLTGQDAGRGGLLPRPTFVLEFGGQRVTIPFAATFGDAAPGELVGYADSAGLVAIAVNGGDAARRLALRTGTLVTLSVIGSSQAVRERRPPGASKELSVRGRSVSRGRMAP
jgi:S-adenosyl-L-methionine hydrolase (adenosine-forming)